MSVNSETATTKDIRTDLKNIWAKLLQKECISEDDNFFELGGDSLQAMSMLFHLARVSGVELTPDALYENPTLGELASHIEQITDTEINTVHPTL